MCRMLPSSTGGYGPQRIVEALFLGVFKVALWAARNRALKPRALRSWAEHPDVEGSTALGADRIRALDRSIGQRSGC